MSNNNETRDESKRRKLAQQGALMEAYGQTSFVKIYPAFGIERVKFSFADIGSKGQGFDIYVELDEFELLCDDILNKDLKRAILSETKTAQNKYPCSWKYVTGTNGEKEIRISKGMKSEVNIYGKCGSKMKNVPMTYNTLRSMAKYFQRVSVSHFDMLTQLTLQGMKKNANYFKLNEEDIATNVTYEEDEKVNEVSQNETNKHEENDVVILSTTTEVKKVHEGMFCMDVIDKKTNKETKLYFNKDSINSMGEKKWLELQESSKNKTLFLTIRVKENKGAYLFVEMAAA